MTETLFFILGFLLGYLVRAIIAAFKEAPMVHEWHFIGRTIQKVGKRKAQDIDIDIHEN